MNVHEVFLKLIFVNCSKMVFYQNLCSIKEGHHSLTKGPFDIHNLKVMNQLQPNVWWDCLKICLVFPPANKDDCSNY